jgi:hypothetical protein
MPAAAMIVRMESAMRPLASDHLTHVAWVDAQLKHGDRFGFDCTDLNMVGITGRIDKSAPRCGTPVRCPLPREAPSPGLKPALAT